VNLQPTTKVASFVPTANLLKIGEIVRKFWGFSPKQTGNGWKNSADVVSHDLKDGKWK
jgi:hypothetical protein